MAFKLPSSLNHLYKNNESHLLTISVSNPEDSYYTKLYLVSDNKNITLTDNSFKTPMNIIFIVFEENIKDISENSFYVLEVESSKYQFITISVKLSMFYKSRNKLYSEIIPNSGSIYSYLNSSIISVEEECFELNEKYLEDNFQDSDFLYVSIEYFTNPIYAYVRYHENDEIPIPKEPMDLSQRTINIILEKKLNKYPSICFYNGKKFSSFKLEVSHLSNTSDCIDIYNPLI